MAEAPPPAVPPLPAPRRHPPVQKKSWVDRWVVNNMPSREQLAQSRG